MEYFIVKSKITGQVKAIQAIDKHHAVNVAISQSWPDNKHEAKNYKAKKHGRQ